MNRISAIWLGGITAMVMALMTSAPVQAEAFEFVRVTCVGERGYFEIEYKTVEQEVFEGATHRGRSFADYGFLDPHSANFECRLGNVVYFVSTHQEQPRASGMCGGAPPIILTVRRDKQLLIDRVSFGSTCNGESSITHFWVHEGEAISFPAEMSLCIAPDVTDFKIRAPEEVCPYLGPDEAARATPITPNRIKSCRTRDKEGTCLTTDSG